MTAQLVPNSLGKIGPNLSKTVRACPDLSALTH